MKKLIMLTFLLALSAGLMAQRSASTTAVPWNVTTKTLTLTSVDSITQGATAYWVFNIDRPKLQFFVASVAIDTMEHVNNHIYVDVLGSMDGTNYVATGATQVKYGATVDSTFQLYDVSTGVLWKYLKVQFVSKDANLKGSRVKGLSLKVVDAK